MIERIAHVAELNLARKWRSQQFDEIVGQELPVRMLKNSLYLGHYFPVYLFSGQRGCGKTTTARVFAAAVNCEQLATFKKSPKTVLPCLECASCIAMQKGKHPDFIEIDAASHTGVDNVRTIIDSSSLMPILGSKKIYLIDEAHMLSKAAFNALLKILEEPPASVLFILATTDPQKILETVKSRCFQLYFNAIDSTLLHHHIGSICKSEEIPYEKDGVELIVKQAQGSARDAINLLEQVRFATGTVTKSAVAQVLGHISDEEVMELFSLIMQQKPRRLLSFLATSPFNQSNVMYTWQKLIELLRNALWSKYQVKPTDETCDYERLTAATTDKTVTQLQQMMQWLYDNEHVLLKTTNQHSFFEMILLQLCTIQKKKTDDEHGGNNSVQTMAIPDDKDWEEEEDDEELEDEEEEEEEEEEGSEWQHFLEAIVPLGEPLISSVFQQGKFVTFDSATQKVEVEFAKDFIFFKEWLEETAALWMPLLEKSFKGSVTLSPLFTGEPKASVSVKGLASSTISNGVESKLPPAPAQSGRPPQRRFSRSIMSKEKKVDISDVSHWKKANLIVRYFPGTVIELNEPS